VFRDEVRDGRFTVHAVAPERTSWEKVALLHDETYREGAAAPKARLARHYYDLWCLMTRGVGERAARDTELFERVAAHRAVFFRRSRDAQALPPDVRARLVRIAELIEAIGLPNVREPHVRHIRGPLWEIRLKGKAGIARALYVTAGAQRVVIAGFSSRGPRRRPRARSILHCRGPRN
jgi:hypothetical protein